MIFLRLLFVLFVWTNFPYYSVGKIAEKSNQCFVRQEEFDLPSGKYFMKWMIDSDLETAMFDLQVETLSHTIEFAFSHFGKITALEPADFVQAGFLSSGEPFILDRSLEMGPNHGFKVETDEQQDYHLVNLENGEGNTMRIVFWRKFNTNDSQDIVFDMSLLHILWFNEPFNTTANDVRSSEVYLLDPKFSVSKDDKVDIWEIKRKMTLPEKPTTYWCTLHKLPETVKRKQHVVGFKTLLEEELGRKHTHHLVLYKCDTNLTDGEAKTLYEPYVNFGGEECYRTEESLLPIEKCRTFVYVWGYGGQEFFFPEDVGFPIGESDKEYYLMEVHFDNPQSLANLKVEVGVQIFYTKNLRENEPGLAMIGYDISPTLVIPPKTNNLVVSGHCQPSCTSKIIPEKGITVFAVLLHTHTCGRNLSLYHFRQNQTKTDSDRITYDDYYDFRFQNARPLLKRRKIFPGDHLVTECSYSTKWKNETTFGGLSTQEEMCLSFLWYYPKVPTFTSCTSEVPIKKIMRKFGVEKISLNTKHKHRQWVVTGPKLYKNRTLQDVFDNHISWDDTARQTLAKFYKAETQSKC